MGGWTKANTISLSSDFKPSNPKSNEIILVIHTFFFNNKIHDRMIQVEGNSTDYILETRELHQCPIFMVDYHTVKSSEDESNTYKIDTVNINFLHDELQPDRMYSISLINDNKKRGFIYRPIEKIIDHYIEI